MNWNPVASPPAARDDQGRRLAVRCSMSHQTADFSERGRTNGRASPTPPEVVKRLPVGRVGRPHRKQLRARRYSTNSAGLRTDSPSFLTRA